MTEVGMLAVMLDAMLSIQLPACCFAVSRLALSTGNQTGAGVSGSSSVLRTAWQLAVTTWSARKPLRILSRISCGVGSDEADVWAVDIAFLLSIGLDCACSSGGSRSQGQRRCGLV